MPEKSPPYLFLAKKMAECGILVGERQELTSVADKRFANGYTNRPAFRDTFMQHFEMRPLQTDTLCDI